MNILEELQELSVSEECLEDILSIVEELINERNKDNKLCKQNWEQGKLGCWAWNNLANNEKKIYYLKKHTPPKAKDQREQDYIDGAMDTAVNNLSKESHKLLGRSGESPDEATKHGRGLGSRKGASKDGSRKEYVNDPLKVTARLVHSAQNDDSSERPKWRNILKATINQMKNEKKPNLPKSPTKEPKEMPKLAHERLHKIASDMKKERGANPS